LLRDDTLEREDAVDAGRLEPGFIGDALGETHGFRERHWIDTEAATGIVRGRGQHDLERAALEALGREPARSRLQSLVAERRAKAQIEAAPVDALGFPPPAESAMQPARVGKTRHAGEGQLRLHGIGKIITSRTSSRRKPP